jgi:hypothetical protein
MKPNDFSWNVKTPAIGTYQNKLNYTYTIKPYFSEAHFNITFPPTLTFRSYFLSLRLSNKTVLCISYFSRAFYMLRPFCAS